MMAGHDRAVLQFSGGKDSTALLYMARPWLDRIDVVHVDTGSMFPHMADHVRATADRLGVALTVLRSDSAAWTAAHGLPADIVPTESAEAAPYIAERRPRLVNYMACCHANLMAPMHDYVARSGVTLVLRGSKAADARVGVPDGHVEGGIGYRQPLWSWTDADVFAYLRRKRVDLPAQYAAGVNDGLDCWFCPAHLAHGGVEKLMYLRQAHPDLWPSIAANIRTVAESARRGVTALDAAWAIADEQE